MTRRLSAVEREELAWKAVELSAKGKNDSEIGRILGLDRRTVKAYMENELARRAEMRDQQTERHLEVYTTIQRAAWEAFENTPDRSLNKSSYLNTAKACEDSKTKLTGAEAPTRHQVDVTTREVPETEIEFLETLEAYRRDANAVQTE